MIGSIILLLIETIFVQLLNSQGKTVAERLTVPKGYTRISAPNNSFGYYLQNFPLKEAGAKVYYFDGREKTNAQYIAVLDIDRGTRDLQQCADAVMRLRAEYLYKQKRFSEISFNTFSGISMTYEKYKQGYRMTPNKYEKIKSVDTSYNGFRKYLDMVFNYANTYTLEKELNKVNLDKMQIGDVFIVSNIKSYGHAMIVMDVAENKAENKKVFLLAQSYMPAQDIHIVKNPVGGYWYSLNEIKDELYTPEWTFPSTSLHRF